MMINYVSKFQILCSIMFITIVYVLSDQPMDFERFIWFGAMALAVGLTSQGLGYLIGSVFSITVSILACV